MKDAEFLESIIKEMVDNPENVQVQRTVDEMGVLMTISGVVVPDMGKIIGREGNTAKAIRTIMRAIGMKTNSRINVRILEADGSRFNRSHEE